MKRFAVAFINFYDNDLSIEIVCASDWKEALGKHSKLNETSFSDCATLEEAKQEAFEVDEMVDVKEIE